MKLLEDLSEHLNEMDVEWHLCGGFDIDTYIGEILGEQIINMILM